MYNWTLNFLKGRVRSSNTKVKILKKVCVVWKNHKYIFCSLKWDLFDGNNFSQHLLTFCCLDSHSHWKVTWKTLKFMIWLKGWRDLWILVFRLAYYIQMKFKGSYQLLRNHFIKCWELHFLVCDEIRWNLDFGQISLLFYA